MLFTYKFSKTSVNEMRLEGLGVLNVSYIDANGNFYSQFNSVADIIQFPLNNEGVYKGWAFPLSALKFEVLGEGHADISVLLKDK